MPAGAQPEHGEPPLREGLDGQALIAALGRGRVSTDLASLQRTAGNQAVRRLLQRVVVTDESAPTEAPPPTPTVSDNPLTGLTKGDGFHTAFNSDIRTRVKKLQNKLNIKLPAKLGVDGAFGAMTTKALHEFQADLGNPQSDVVDQDTANVLLDRPREKPDEPEPKPNKLDLGPLMFNAQLEATFDQIVEQYGEVLARQGQALNQFRTELGDPEKKQPGLMARLLIEGANLVIGRTLGGAETSLRNVAKSAARSALDTLPSFTPDKAKEEVVKKSVEDPFTSAEEGGKKVVESAVAPSTTSASVADFVASQHAGQIASHRDAVKSFQASKQSLRQFTPEDTANLGAQPIPGMVDPRLDRANAVLTGVQQAATRAIPKTYREVVGSWATINARRGLMEHGSTRTDVTEVGQLQDADTGTVLGVLEVSITFNPSNPKQAVRVKELRIAGLSQAVRDRISGVKGGDSPTVGQLGFPVRIQGSEGGGLFGIGSTDIAVAAPEDRRSPEKVNKGDTSADGYFAAKGADTGGALELRQFAGIRKVVEEVDAVLVKTIGLQGP